MIKVGIAVAVAATLCTGAASAAPTTYGFEGVLTDQYQFDPIPEWQFAAGQRFYGEVVYDPAAVTSSWDVVTQPDWQVTNHYTALVSMQFTVELPGDDYHYVVPTQKLTNAAYQYVQVTRGPEISTGVAMRTHNYPEYWVSGPPSAPVPQSAYVGAYNPHMVDLIIVSPYTNPDSYKLLPNTSADIDLAALFASMNGKGASNLSVRFSDSYAWDKQGYEHLQADLSGRIDNLWKISSVPEPQSWALMIAGFGLAGAALRYSTRKARPVRLG